MARRLPTGFTLCLIFSLFLIVITSCTASARPPQPPPPSRPASRAPAGPAGEDRAYGLFRLAQKVNPGLRWDDCMARKARERAMTIVATGAFSHRDPRTGKNPFWPMVTNCHPCRCAAENLAQSSEPAESVHRLLMGSPHHRENIVNPAYSLMGAGCHEDICVELFGGF